MNKPWLLSTYPKYPEPLSSISVISPTYKWGIPWSYNPLIRSPVSSLPSRDIQTVACRRVSLVDLVDLVQESKLRFSAEGVSLIVGIWLVVSTHLKHISQIGSFPQVGMKINNI